MNGTVRTINPVCGMIADMKRLLTGVTAWIAGTALAVGLAWFGAGIVVRNTAMTPSVPTISPAGPARSQTPASPRATESAPSASPTASPSPTAAGTLRSYTMTGGRVTLDMTATSATLVTAVPNSGYSVQNWSGTDWLRVDFSSGTKVSSLIASWNGHAPAVSVTN